MTRRRSTLRADLGAVRDATLTMARLGEAWLDAPIPRAEYNIEKRGEGFVVTDEYGADVNPTERHATWNQAAGKIAELRTKFK